MKKHLWWIITAGVLVLLFLALRGSAGSPVEEGNDPNAHIKGNPESSVVLIEYSDFECPACASIYPVIERLANETDVRIEYRHFPLVQIHPYATLAAQATEAAALQGKFWDMHDVIFNTQSEWARLDNAEPFFISLADSIGIDTEKFEADLHSSEVKAAVTEDARRASRLRLPGTPSFILNGEILESVGSYESLKAQVEAAAQ